MVKTDQPSLRDWSDISLIRQWYEYERVLAASAPRLGDKCDKIKGKICQG